MFSTGTICLSSQKLDPHIFTLGSSLGIQLTHLHNNVHHPPNNRVFMPSPWRHEILNSYVPLAQLLFFSFLCMYIFIYSREPSVIWNTETRPVWGRFTSPTSVMDRVTAFTLLANQTGSPLTHIHSTIITYTKHYQVQAHYIRNMIRNLLKNNIFRK